MAGSVLPGDPLTLRVRELGERIEAACRESSRTPQEIRVLPATKTQPIEFLDRLHAMGFEIFGESRIGEFARKLQARPSYSWEFIGRFRPADAGLLAKSARLIHS